MFTHVLISQPKYFSNRSSDSAKYTNKSSGTSVLSGNINTSSSSFHPKFYSGSNHHEHERQSHVNITTAPVHKKIVANKTSNDSQNHIINRFINNNNPQTYNNHYSLSLKRHAENYNAKHGVGCTLISPYAGSGVEKVRGTKSDIGIPLESKLMHQNGHKSSILQKINSSSGHSDLSIYKTIYNGNDTNNNIIYNNNSMRTPISSAITFSKTGTKLLYTNKHRFNSPLTDDNAYLERWSNDANAKNLGPLLYKNKADDSRNGNCKYINPTQSVSRKRISMDAK